MPRGASALGASTKIHQLIGGDGMPLVACLHPGAGKDPPMLLPLLAALCVVRQALGTTPDAMYGDKG